MNIETTKGKYSLFLCWIQSAIILAPFAGFFDAAILNAASADFIIKDFPIPLIEADFLRLSPFRAPPALV